MNLLIADDEHLIRQGLLSLNWKSIGIDEVYSAANGLEAENLLLTVKIDLVIFDIRMPGLTGLELSKLIQERAMDTRVILLTGFSEFEYAQQAIQYHVASYILKPIRPKEILQIVNRVKISLEEEREKNSLLNQYEKKYKEGLNQTDLTAQVLHAFPDTSTQVADLLKTLTEKYQEPLSLKQLAETFHFSENYMSKKIKNETGVSFANLLTAIRLTAALALMRSDQKISEVAEKTGFSDQRYFSKQFHKFFGSTPTVYREENQIQTVSFYQVLQKVTGK